MNRHLTVAFGTIHADLVRTMTIGGVVDMFGVRWTFIFPYSSDGLQILQCKRTDRIPI